MSERLRAEFDACLKGISLRENALHRELCETRASLNEARDNFGRQHRQLLEAEQQNAALLAEVERLQDNYDTALGACVEARKEILALREALTLTPEKVEAAAKAQYEFDNPGGPEFKACTFRCLYLGASRAALLAAGMEAQP